MIRVTKLTNKYGKCGSSIEFEESKDAALYLWAKETCSFLITKDDIKFETSSSHWEDIERYLDNFLIDRKAITEYENKLIAVLAEHTCYTKKDVEHVFIKCGKSFDKTERALHLGSAYNNIELGILEANK